MNKGMLNSYWLRVAVHFRTAPSFGGHSAAVGQRPVRESNSPATELLAQDSILFTQVFQRILLALIGPSCSARMPGIETDRGQAFPAVLTQAKIRRIEFLDSTSAEHTPQSIQNAARITGHLTGEPGE